jgi:hypothetical protein
LIGELRYQPVVDLLRGDLVDPQGLRSRRAIGDAVVYGFECGVALARASSPKLAQRLDRRVTAAQYPQIVSSRLADRFAQHGTVAVGITVRGEEVFLELADGTIYDAASVIAELAATCREYKIGNVELRCGTRPPLTANAGTLAEVARLCREAGGQMAATALWPVLAVGRLQLGAEPAAVYTEMAERAAWAAMRIVAPRLGIKFDAPLIEGPAAAKELDAILKGLLSAWRLLPGRAPGDCADVPQRIRAAQAALGRPEHLFGAGKALHQATTRDGPAELPWFAPFADAQEAA